MPENAPDSTYLWGYALLISTFIAFIVTVYVTVGTYFVPYTGNKVSFRLDGLYALYRFTPDLFHVNRYWTP